MKGPSPRIALVLSSMVTTVLLLNRPQKNVQLNAAKLPSSWTHRILEELQYEPYEWNFRDQNQESVVVKMPGRTYIIFRMDPEFKLEVVSPPADKNTQLQKMHAAFHELDLKYQTLLRWAQNG